MRRWRVGTFSMGLSLIFLGSAFFVGQFNRELGTAIARNCWPFILVALGIEILLSNIIRNKSEIKYSYDFLSLIFVGILALVSLGVYSLEAVGLWDRLAEVASGELSAVEHRVAIEPAGRLDKIVLDCGDFRQTVRVLDGTGTEIVLRIRGQAYRSDHAEQTLAAVGSIEQIGSIVYVNLHRLAGEAPWTPQIDGVDLIVPAKYKIETGSRPNLALREFHGITSILPGPLEDMREAREPSLRLRLPVDLEPVRGEIARLEAELRIARSRGAELQPVLDRIEGELGEIEEDLERLLEEE